MCRSPCEVRYRHPWAGVMRFLFDVTAGFGLALNLVLAVLPEVSQVSYHGG